MFTPSSPPKPVPATPFIGPDGAAVSLADFRGRGVVLNFWATWCAPCVREMPQLNRLKTLLAEHGIDVLAVSEDRAGAAVVDKFYKVNKLDALDIYIDEGMKLLRALKVRGLPTTVLIDRSGHEVGRTLGIAEWDAPEVSAFVRRCLGKDG